MNFERKSDEGTPYGMHPQMSYNYNQPGPPGLQFNGPVQHPNYEKEQKLKKSISGLAFWLTILGIFGGFLGAYLYDRAKTFKKQLGKRPFVRGENFSISQTEDGEHKVDERFEIYDQHKEFRDKSMKTMKGGDQSNFRGDDENELKS